MDETARAQLLKIRLLGGSEDDQADWYVWYTNKGAPEDEPKVGDTSTELFNKLARTLALRTRSSDSFPAPTAPVHQAPQPQIP